MLETVITAVVTGGIALLGTVITVKASSEKTVAVMQAEIKGNQDLVNERFDHIKDDISELSNRVEKHNSVIDRTYKLEKAAELTDEKLKVANNRIKDLEMEKRK